MDISLGIMVFGLINMFLGMVIMMICTIPKLTTVYYKQIVVGQEVGIRFFGIGIIFTLVSLAL